MVTFLHKIHKHKPFRVSEMTVKETNLECTALLKSEVIFLESVFSLNVCYPDEFTVLK